jgi:hypothetical protein
MRLPFFTLRAAAALAGVAALAACEASNDPAGLNQSGMAYSVLPSFPADGQADVEEFELCKQGSSATFDYSVFDRSTSTTTSGSLTLNDGECRVIALFGDVGADVTVTETSAQSGYMFDRVDVTRVGVNAGSYSQTTPSVTEFVSGTNGGGLRGALAVYYNVPEPPPPGGGEGCTPGYWKQSQHFDSWTGYAPTDLFSSVFEDAFPGMTLLQVLGQGGGGLKALGRHTVAALLNTASAGVDYDMTTQGVIDAFNAVYPGGDYEGQKNIFAGYNELGCPLN